MEDVGGFLTHENGVLSWPDGFHRAGTGMIPEVTDRHDGGLLRIDCVALDSASRRLHIDGFEPIALTPVEAKLLRCLMERRGEYLSSRDLLPLVWGYPADGGSDLVRAHMSNVRRKLRTAGRESLLHTRPYCGYAYVGDQQDGAA
jgi:DNA-binding response OmpR family regulator